MALEINGNAQENIQSGNIEEASRDLQITGNTDGAKISAPTDEQLTANQGSIVTNSTETEPAPKEDAHTRFARFAELAKIAENKHKQKILDEVVAATTTDTVAPGYAKEQNEVQAEESNEKVPAVNEAPTPQGSVAAQSNEINIDENSVLDAETNELDDAEQASESSENQPVKRKIKPTTPTNRQTKVKKKDLEDKLTSLKKRKDDLTTSFNEGSLSEKSYNDAARNLDKDIEWVQNELDMFDINLDRSRISHPENPNYLGAPTFAKKEQKKDSFAKLRGAANRIKKLKEAKPRSPEDKDVKDVKDVKAPGVKVKDVKDVKAPGVKDKYVKDKTIIDESISKLLDSLSTSEIEDYINWLNGTRAIAESVEDAAAIDEEIEEIKQLKSLHTQYKGDQERSSKKEKAKRKPQKPSGMRRSAYQENQNAFTSFRCISNSGVISILEGYLTGSVSKEELEHGVGITIVGDGNWNFVKRTKKAIQKNPSLEFMPSATLSIRFIFDDNGVIKDYITEVSELKGIEANALRYKSDVLGSISDVLNSSDKKLAKEIGDRLEYADAASEAEDNANIKRDERKKELLESGEHTVEKVLARPRDYKKTLGLEVESPNPADEIAKQLEEADASADANASDIGKDIVSAENLVENKNKKDKLIAKEGDGTTVNKNGEIIPARYTQTASQVLNYLSFRYEISTAEACELVRAAASIGVDSEGKRYNSGRSGYDGTALSDNEWVAAYNIIKASQEKYGHPFGFTSMNVQPKNLIGGVPRFPLGCVSNELIEKLARSEALSEYPDETALKIAIKETWLNETQPALIDWAANHGEDGQRQQGAIYNMTRGYCKHNSDSSSDYNVPDSTASAFASSATDNILSASEMRANKNENRVRENERQKRAHERKEQRRNIKFGKTSTIKADPDSITTEALREELAPKASDICCIWNNLVQIGASGRVFGNILLYLPGVGEKGIGLAETRAATLLQFVHSGNTEYKIDADAIKTAARNRTVRSAFDNMARMLEVLDTTDIDEFFERGLRVDDNMAVSNFLHEKNPYYRDDGGKFLMATQKLAEKSSGLVNSIMASTRSLKTAELEVWLECYMLNNMKNESPIDAEAVVNMLREDPGRFMHEALSSLDGQDAVMCTLNGYAARINPTTKRLTRFFNENGFAKPVVTAIMGSFFVKFGIVMYDLMTPFSNVGHMIEVEGMGIGDVREHIGSSLNQKDAFWRALALDLTKAGRLMIFALAAFLVSIAGLDEPDKEEDREYPWAWKIFGGPVYQNWFMDDTFMWALYLGEAVAVGFKTGDPALAYKLFTNGVNKVLGSNQVVKMYGALLDLPLAANDLVMLTFAQDKDPDSEIGQFIVNHEDIGLVAADQIFKRLNNMLPVPMAISDAYTLIWSDDIKRNSRTYEDGEYRNGLSSTYNKYAVYNPVMAFLGNVFCAANSAATNTGRGFNEFGRDNSAKQTVEDKDLANIQADNSLEAFYKKQKGDENASFYDESDEAKEQIRNSYAHFIYDTLYGSGDGQYNGDLDAAYADGFSISRGDMYTVSLYMNKDAEDRKAQLIDLANKYGNRDISSDDYWIQRTEISNGSEGCYTIWNRIDNLWDSELVKDAEVYYEVEGNYVATNTTDYGSMNFGDSKAFSTYAPFVIPKAKTDEQGEYMADHYGTKIGNNYETNKYNVDGYSVSDITTMPTSGGRNLVVADDDTPKVRIIDPKTGEETMISSADLDELIDEQEALIESGKQEISDATDDANEKRSTYSPLYSSSYSRGYSYYGGSSYSSTPKIYSYSAGVLNVDKPSTMYSKSYQNATTTYLSPSTSTTGSRSAYSRKEY